MYQSFQLCRHSLRSVGGAMALLIFALPASTMVAWQDATQPATTTPIVDDQPVQFYWQVGMTVTPTTFPVKNGSAIIPIPGQWPEQFVRVHEEMSTPGISYREEDADDGLRAFIVDVPALATNEKAEMKVVFDISLTPIKLPDQPQYLKRPEKFDRSINRYLNASPLIDPRSSAVRKLAKELMQDKHNDWETISAFWEWILDNIELSMDQPVGSKDVLENKKGCREDRVSLFVALCRSQKIPARTVWADRMEYAEFYLVDGDGNGAWYPCLFSGPREFGYLSKPVVIEQKGDNFEVRGIKDKKRFVNATASITTTRPAQSASQRPNVVFDRRQIPAALLQNQQ